MKIRLGLVPYLNVKVLSYPLLSGAVRHNFSFTFALPAQLAQALQRGELDVALIPSIEYAAGEDYVILPELAIAARGAVDSVFLFSRKPLSRVRTVALDTASRTSAALLKILFAERFKAKPSYLRAEPPLEKMMEQADAALIIGDNALQVAAEGYYRFDLSREWLRLTGHPFVFAVFAARRGYPWLQESWRLLLQAKALGRRMIRQVAYRAALDLHLDYFTCLDYLSRRICYDLDEQALAGLRSFYRLAGDNRLIGKDVSLKFYRPQNKNKSRMSLPNLRMANA